MDEAENIFGGTVESLELCDLEKPLDKETPHSPSDSWMAFASARLEAEKEGDTAQALVYDFIQTMFGLQPSFYTPAEPFKPFASSATDRSFLPEDLTDEDLEVVRKIAGLAKDPAVRARFWDVLSDRKADHLATRDAALAYQECAKIYDEADSLADASDSYFRALQLASRMGKDKPLFKGIADQLLNAVETRYPNEKKSFCYRYMKHMARFGIGDPVAYAKKSRILAEQATERSEHQRAQLYYKVEMDWHRLAKNQEAASQAELLSAEALVAEVGYDAETRRNFSAASHKLSQAIELIIRNGTAKAEWITDLKARLASYQRKAMGEMTTIDMSGDAKESSELAMKHVTQKHLPDALRKLAFMLPLTDLTKLRANTIDHVNSSITRFVMGNQKDEAGRSIRQIKPLPKPEESDYEDCLEQEMFAYAHKFEWNINMGTLIEPARGKILFDHRPSLEDLEFLVVDNPFVPPGHEGIYLRGLHAGFHGDFLVATHLLVPQIENSIRHLLELNGVDVVNIVGDGTQSQKVLGPLFDIPETLEIFGESLCFELRGVLIEKASHDLRNRIAHGFVSEGECYTITALHVWWIVLRMCLQLHLQSHREIEKEAG